MGGQPYQFTQVNDPAGTDEYQAYMDEVGKQTITYADSSNSHEVPISQLDGFGSVYNTSTAKRMGDHVLSYHLAGDSTSGSTWMVRITVASVNTFTSVNKRPVSPTPIFAGKSGRAERFCIVSFNF